MNNKEIEILEKDLNQFEIKLLNFGIMLCEFERDLYRELCIVLMVAVCILISYILI